MVIQRQGMRQVDIPMIAVVLLISFGGVLAIKSAKHADVHAIQFVGKQIAGIVIGFLAMLWLAMHEYETLLKRFARTHYYVNLALLAIVLKGGHSSHGAARWIEIGHIEIQPSEFAKLILITTLSFYLADNLPTITTWRTVLKSLGHIAIPVLLIAKQPDLGTALVIIAVWFGVMAMAGAKVTHLLAVLLAGAVLFAGMWHFNILLKDYQKNRLEVFIKPDADPRDTGYHLRQSEIAIGSGEVSGEGYGRGAQSNGKFIPEQHTDFIFTIVGEEGGFVACVLLLACYLLVLERGVVILATCTDPLGRMISAGVISMLTFHVVVNAGMTMGIMPVVGVPLPFFSYGLSSLIVCMSGVGLLLSVDARRHRVIF
jgi:rod shape determining protein RodA